MTRLHRDRRRHRAGSRVLAAALAALGVACSSWRPVEEPNRRAEEGIERVAAPVLPTKPAATAPARNAAPALAPPPLLSGAESARSRARPLSELARRNDAPGARREVVLMLDDLRFAPGDPALDARSRAALDLLAGRLLHEPLGYVLEIQGHSDSSGSEPENLRLGLERAVTVRDYLARKGGVPREWTAVVSLGSAQPVADNATSEGRSRNRRAVVLVLR